MWYADDATANGKIKKIKKWRDYVSDIGPKFGYHVNALKSWLIVKESSFGEAKRIFAGSNVQITTQGQRHLGAALGSATFVEKFVSDKVKKWVDEVIILTDIARSQPHAAFAALCHILINKWSYLARTISNIGDLFTPLEEAIRFQLLPAITGRDAFSDLEQDLFALPTQIGGLGITNLILEANDCYVASREITAPLSMLIDQQSNHFPNIIIPTRQDRARDQMKEKTATSKPSKISEGGPLFPAAVCNGPEPREGCFTLAKCPPTVF